MEAQDAITRVEALTAELERLPDSRARGLAEDLVSAVLDLHAEALEGLLAELGPMAARRIAEEQRVAAVLLIHGLHPVPLEQRVREGLDEVRPYMASHGGDVELLGIDDGIAYLRLKGTCNGCRASSSTLELAVQKALEEAAPDLLGMQVDGAVEEPAITGSPLPMMQMDSGGNGTPVNGGGNAPRQLDDWSPLDGAADVEPGALRAMAVGGSEVLIANVDGELLAYRERPARGRNQRRPQLGHASTPSLNEPGDSAEPHEAHASR